MSQILNVQMYSGVNVDVRETVEKQVALAARALQWLRGKAMDGEHVTISQLASYLKVKKAVVPGVIETLVGSRDNYNASSGDETVICLYVFVANNQIPDWLRPLLSTTDTYRLLNRARNVDGPTIMFSREFRKQLLASPDFVSNLTRVWEHGRNAIVRSLYTVGFIENPDFQHPVVMDWFGNPNGGNSGPGKQYEDGLSWSLDFARGSYRMIDKLDFDKATVIELGKPLRLQKLTLSDEECAKALAKTQSLIDWMAITEYKLTNASYSMSSVSARAMLTFRGKSGMGETVTVRLPWDNLTFRIKR
jgi:hypothetical protein